MKFYRLTISFAPIAVFIAAVLSIAHVYLVFHFTKIYFRKREATMNADFVRMGEELYK